jgi:hypothetical protein
MDFHILIILIDSNYFQNFAFIKNVMRRLYSHFLHEGRKCFFFFPISPHFYPVKLNFLTNIFYTFFFTTKTHDIFIYESLLFYFYFLFVFDLPKSLFLFLIFRQY